MSPIFKLANFFLFGLKRPANEFLAIFLVDGVFLEGLLDHLLHTALAAILSRFLLYLGLRRLL